MSIVLTSMGDVAFYVGGIFLAFLFSFRMLPKMTFETIVAVYRAWRRFRRDMVNVRREFPLAKETAASEKVLV